MDLFNDKTSNDSSWSDGAMKLMKKLNNFCEVGSSKGQCVPLVIDGDCVGILLPVVVKSLRNYPETFLFVSDEKDDKKVKQVQFNPTLNCFDSRSKAMLEIVKDLTEKDVFETLRFWRNEDYNVSSGPSQPAMFKMERAATSLFGVRTYGAHMNGYVRHPERGMCLWIARRSPTKQTFPGMLDNMVAGGIGVGYGIKETMIKECYEEAGIPESIAKDVVPVGCVSYIYENSRGVNPEVQYCFDLELPLNFEPSPVDGEVEEFKLCDLKEVKELIVQDDFKPNCAAVTLDFLIRLGFITADNEPRYCELIQGMHNHDLSY